MYRLFPGNELGEGPWTPEAIRQALRDGKLSLQAQACLEGESDRGWKRLEEFAEFQDLRQADGRRQVPPLPISAPQPPLPSPPQPPPLPGGKVDPRNVGKVGAEGKPRVSGLAIASIVVGVFGFLVVPALLGIGLGIGALVQVRRSGKRVFGRGLAWAGIVVSTLMLVIGLVGVWAFVQFAQRGRFPMAQPRAVVGLSCHERLLQLGSAVRGYALDHADVLPDANVWCDAVKEYANSSDVFLCPQDGKRRRSSFAMNREVAGKNLEQLSEDTVLLFETDAAEDWNTAGDVGVAKERGGGVWVYLAGGSVQQFTLQQLQSARWKP